MDAVAMRSLLEQQLTLSRTLKNRIAELEGRRTEPLAVVGMGLRLPGGVCTPEQYWDLLLGDDVAVREAPEDRPGLRAVYDPQPGTPGASYTRRAGFLDDIGGFDAGFFGISQREAESLDPQQRLLLETSWEALERAGVAVRREDRLPVGVFVGIMASEYGERLAGGDRTGIDPYFGTGGGHCFAAGRLSYTFGFSGPALSVDTACSSSLTALHLASQSLRRGECRYALVGAANLVLSADLMVSLAQSQALSADGRSKTFTAAADGYGRGEGVGVLVLMRLSDALAEGRAVHAVVRGTAVNHDGASSGLTVPSGPAQQEVIRAALADAGVTPEQVGYVEAHGTGTSLGDPIEVGALDAVFGSLAPAPLALGSVKSRIGHLEAAAGLAGLIKLVLMLGRGVIPAGVLPSDGPLNPLIPWDRISAHVPSTTGDWPAPFSERIAGISAFGLSGTNAHAVLAAYPAAAAAPAVTGADDELVTVSAKDPQTLTDLARVTAAALRAGDDLAATAHTLRTGRATFTHRLAAVGSTAAEIADALLAAVPAPVQDGTATLTVGPDAGALQADVCARFPLLGHGSLERQLRALGARVTVRDAATTQLHLGDDVVTITGVRGFLSAVALLYRAGHVGDLAALSAPSAVHDPHLPTYPFQRRRYWIDEPVAEPVSEPVADPGAAAVPVAVLVPADRLEQAPSRDVRGFVLESLCELLKAESLDESLPFAMLGGDSFIGMLLAKSVEDTYGVEIPAEELAVDVPLAMLVDQIVERVDGDTCARTA